MVLDCYHVLKIYVSHRVKQNQHEKYYNLSIAVQNTFGKKRERRRSIVGAFFSA